MNVNLELIKNDLKNWSIQITNRLNAITGGDKPILVKTIKIIGGGGILFIVTQILRKIWYSSYHKIKKYPPGTSQYYYIISRLI